MALKLRRVVLILVLIIGVSGALAAPAQAESLQTAGRQIEVGIVVVSVAVEARSVTQDLGACHL
jgi:hypothetical protein